MHLHVQCISFKNEFNFHIFFLSALGFERMMASLTQCEYTMEKSLLVHNMNTKEQENYNRLSQDIGNVITDSVKI